jgi:hypothetical protein
MEQFPFAVDSDSSPIVAAAGDDASSLVTASSQGSFVPTSEDDGLHSSSNQQIDEDTVAVFANLTPDTQHPPQIPIASLSPPTPSISFNATIVDLPPPTNVLSSNRPIPSAVSTSSSTNNGGVAATSTATSLLNGVDALKSAGSRVTSVLSHFGYSLGNSSTSAAIRPSGAASNPPSVDTMTTQPKNPILGVIDTLPEEATIDFAYINVTDEDEVDIWLDENHSNAGHLENPSVNRGVYDTHDSVNGSHRGDILAILLASDVSPQTSPHADDITHAPTISEQLVELTEKANEASAKAVTSRQNGNLQAALDRHADAAKFFHQAAVLIREQDGTFNLLFCSTGTVAASACNYDDEYLTSFALRCKASLANSLLLLSQTQAKSALALKRVIKLRPNTLASTFQTNKNRLRATVRVALNRKPEADISDSTFLGRASKPPLSGTSSDLAENHLDAPNKPGDATAWGSNPVDEIMELERELREMDMALSLGNSIVSLDSRVQNRMKSSVSESFMVVPGSGSYMSSSNSVILGPAPSSTSRPYNPNIGGTAGVRARANRLQNVARPSHPLSQPIASQSQTKNLASVPSPSPLSLESSWWGNASMASQVLSASTVSIATGGAGNQQLHVQQSASTKQLMRLMDSLRTLGDENASLLREVEDAEAARLEAKTAREQMKRFKEEYGKRFAALKEALDKFRKGYPDETSTSGEMNPVTNSAFLRSATASDQMQRQEQLIRKLTADLKKEKEESKKKDSALRKYESFYREVKARSAQKAAQRQTQHQVPPNPR